MWQKYYSGSACLLPLRNLAAWQWLCWLSEQIDRMLFLWPVSHLSDYSCLSVVSNKNKSLLFCCRQLHLQKGLPV